MSLNSDAPPAAATTRSGGLDASRMAMAAALVMMVAVRLASLGPVIVNGNADNYLRAAAAASRLDFRSRMSPGLPVLLSPLARLFGRDYMALSVASELVLLAASVAALLALDSYLRIRLRPWLAAGLVAVLALGQTATINLRSAEVEPLALLVVTGCLLALERSRTGIALVLTAVGAISRVALGPFLAILWFARVRKTRRSALVGLTSVALGVVAHFARGAPSEETYTSILSDTYLSGHAIAIGSDLVRFVWGRLIDYVRLGVPAMVWPFGLLETTLGTLAAAATVGLLLFGMWRALSAEGSHGDRACLGAATVAATVYFGMLLMWPVRDIDMVRMVLPMAGLILLFVGVGAADAARRFAGGRAHVALAAGVAGALACGIAATGMWLGPHRQPPQATRDFVAAHERAVRARLPEGPILSTRSAITEILTGREAIPYRMRADAAFVDRMARARRVCVIVAERTPRGRARGVGERRLTLVASAGRTSVHAIAAPWCP